MNKIVIANELLKIANELFEIEEQPKTEHQKIVEFLKSNGKKYNGIVSVQIKLSNDLLTELDYNDLKIDNLDKIVINLSLTPNTDYQIDNLTKQLNKAKKHAKLIQDKIKTLFNKDVKIVLNYN